MRKFLALIMVALLTLTMALAVVGCGGGQPATEATPPAATPAPETAMPADTMAMPAAVDTATGGH